MSLYEKHIFVCCNNRDNGRKCCYSLEAIEALNNAKQKIKKSGYAGRVRINASDCLGQCAKGPVMVIYPEGTWVYYTNNNDIEEILEKIHLPQQIDLK